MGKLTESSMSNTSPKVAILSNSLACGGSERIVAMLLQHLTSTANPIALILLENSIFYPVPNAVHYTCLGRRSAKLPGLLKLLMLPIYAWRLKKLVQQQQIDIVQSHLYRANYVNVLAKLLGSPHQAQIVNPSFHSTIYQGHSLSAKINQCLSKWLYPKAQLVITKSKAMLHDLVQQIGKLSQGITLYNPVDVITIQQQISNENNLEKFHFDMNKRYLICVARLHIVKRHVDLLRALTQLETNIELILIGDGPEKNNIQQLAKQLDIAQRVHLLGQIEAPYPYIARSHAFILASSVEGFPNALVEAMACRIPVIAADCFSGPREILAPDSHYMQILPSNAAFEAAEFGLLYPVGNIQALIAATQYLLNDASAYHHYQQQAWHRAHDFSAEKIIIQYQQILFANNKPLSN
jgi:glycosyltransferase involved in cell wall biosynthesis